MHRSDPSVCMLHEIFFTQSNTGLKLKLFLVQNHHFAEASEQTLLGNHIIQKGHA